MTDGTPRALYIQGAPQPRPRIRIARTSDIPVMTRTYAIAVLLAACGRNPATFVVPRNVEDVRARLLAGIPEGRDIAGARQFMADHGFTCEPPLPSATTAHAHPCHADAAHADAGWARWTVTLFERNGRLADVQAR